MADPAPGRTPGEHLPGGAPPPPHPRSRPAAAAVITDARSAASLELTGRMRRYAITMAFRMACFVGMVFVTGWLRWALLGGAVLLPYIAVLFANQSDQRARRGQMEHGAPEDAPQLTAGEPVQIISGQVVEAEAADPAAWGERPADPQGGRPEGRVA